MKRICAAVLLSAAIIFGGTGCPNGLSSGEVDVPEADPNPPVEEPAEAPETDADAADAAPTEQEADDAAAEETEERSSGDGEAQSLQFGSEIVPQSDDRVLEREDLTDLDNWGLTLARNEIFARHGRTFGNEHLRNYFTGQPWYTPDPDYERAWLSAVEQHNENFILEYQKLKYEIPARQPR
ncbi:MAG: YARHG domain-containing protein [Armatimonadota bacterium]